MKYRLLSLALIAAIGCTKTIEGPAYYLDVVHRVTDPQTFSSSPFAEMAHGRVLKKFTNGIGFFSGGVTIDSLENGQKFDAAVGLFRAQSSNGVISATNLPLGRMAFELNNAPTQVGNASLNSVALPWLSSISAIGVDYSYAKSDPNLGITGNNATYSYMDFNGETYKDTVSIAPDFGTITFPDTISLSHGCTISYQHPVANDSIEIYIDVFDSSFLVTKPDTGAIVFAPNELPPDRTYANAGLMISFYRWNWATRTSPSGKKIAVYSSMETEPTFVPYKP